MAVGLINKDVISEGPFPLAFHKIQVDDPSILENVKLWFSDEKQNHTYYMGEAIEKTDSETGEVFYDFNSDTRKAQELLPDESLKTSWEEQVPPVVTPGEDTTRSIVSISESGGVVTIETGVGPNGNGPEHGRSVGDYIRVKETDKYDGEYEVQAVPSPNKLEYYTSSSPPDESGGKVVHVVEKNEYTVLASNQRYIAHVTYTSTAITELRAIGATAEILVREAGPIQ